MVTRTPPRFVPTLTEVVQPSAPAPLTATPVPASASASASATQPSLEHVTQRVMQRVDLALERRLRETVATLVLEQASALAPLLRDRIEAMVREIVSEALDEEMQARQRGNAP